VHSPQGSRPARFEDGSTDPRREHPYARNQGAPPTWFIICTSDECLPGDTFVGATHWTHRLALITTLAVLAVPAFAQPAQFPPGPRANRDWRDPSTREAYERGYREGVRNGERDARSNRPFDYERNEVYRSVNRGSNRDRIDDRGDVRQFQQGFGAGYRVGYQNVRRAGNDRRLSRPGSEPAFARGYADGYEKGNDDGRDRDRYDAVGHKAYREGDEGYFREYGPKEAYRTNYRSGFREGYETGYRDGQWRR
jgi:hypothetical protein